MSTPAIASYALKVPQNAITVWQVMRNYGQLSWTKGINEVILEGEGVGMPRWVRLEGSELPGLESYKASSRVATLEHEPSSCEIRWRCGAKVDDAKIDEMLAVLEGKAQCLVTLFPRQFDNTGS